MKTAIIYYSQPHGNTKKLLDAVADTWDLEAAQATRAKMAAHCQDRARDLEEKLPGLQRMAAGAMTSVRIAENQLRATQARIRFSPSSENRASKSASGSTSSSVTVSPSFVVRSRTSPLSE